MTIHKSKAKQFDGVLILREGRHDGAGLVSPFIWWGDNEPYRRSRKILRVAITRAKALPRFNPHHGKPSAARQIRLRFAGFP
jgi:superfamily I DNA/RNA helicase